MEDKQAIRRETDAILRGLRDANRNNSSESSPFLGTTDTLDIRVPEGVDLGFEAKPTDDEFRSGPNLDPKPGRRQSQPPLRP